tara:strand:+ start:98327 stop:99661 length:1335 start_codon:yes stop_codon:yes gene_type:complete
LLRLALPMMVSQGTFAVMVFTDRWFMAQIDTVHVAAALGGGVASFFCLSLFMGVITYANALVAQYHGAGEIHKCPRVITQGFLMAIACAPLLILIALYGAEAFAHLGHDPAQVPLEQVYFQVLMAGGVLTLVKALLACYFAGISRTRVVMIADVLGMVLNIPLSWALIFGHAGLPQMGIAGAALGTIVASGFSIGVFLLFYCNRVHAEQFHVRASLVLDRGILRRYLRLGAPSGLESFMNTATFNLYLLLFQSYGVAQGAAMAIVFNWDMLNFIPMIGLNIGVMTLIGRFVGAGDMERTNQVIAAGFLFGLGYAGVLAVAFYVFRVSLVDVFQTPDGQFQPVSELATYMMIGLSSYVLADAVLLVCSGVLRGAGDTRWVMVASVSVHWLMLLVQYLVIVVFELGPRVSWWVFVYMLISLAVLYTLRLRSGVWRRPERLARVMAE